MQDVPKYKHTHTQNPNLMLRTKENIIFERGMKVLE